MGNVGRFFCVALPFILTAASLVALLIVGLTGIASNQLYMFRVNTTDMSIDLSELESLLKLTSRNVQLDSRSFLDDLKNITEIEQLGEASGVLSGGNITAQGLGLAQLYDVNLWGYCETEYNGTRTCTKAEINWAYKYLSTDNVTVTNSGVSANVSYPDEVKTAVEVFQQTSKWTQIVVIVAAVALGIELFVGLFTSCSRVVSCITWIFSGLATILVCAAAAAITAMSVLVVGTLEGSNKLYGLHASFNGSFLAVAWIAAAFAIAASFFWLFTICCCKPEHRQKRSRGHGPEAEKFIPVGGYAPLHDDHNRFSQQSYGAPRHQQSGPRSNLAYEPYSHSNV